MIITIQKENKNVNLGIEILRVILCFWVLLFHFLEKQEIKYFLLYEIIKTKFFHVSCFCFISFYYTYNIFSNRNIIKLKKRLERLLLPYILWPIIIFIVHNIFYFKNRISLKELKLQLIGGSEFMVHFWYLLSVILISILFHIFSYLPNFIFVIQLITIISYIIQYSNYDNFLYKYKDNVRYPIVGTMRMFPISVIGITIASSNISEILETNRIKALFFLYLFIYFLFKYNIFINLGGYKGIVHIFSSIVLFFGFYLIPFKDISNFFYKMVKQITSYTNGIYCLHTRIMYILKGTFKFKGNFKTTINIYLIGYFISFIGINLFKKTRLKYLFI